MKEDTPFTVTRETGHRPRPEERHGRVRGEGRVEEPQTDIAGRTPRWWDRHPRREPRQPPRQPLRKQLHWHAEPAAEPPAAVPAESAPAVAPVDARRHASGTRRAGAPRSQDGQPCAFIVGVLLVAGILVIWLVRRGKS